jgi:hypothetical protein
MVVSLKAGPPRPPPQAACRSEHGAILPLVGIARERACAITAQAIRASLLASATTATLKGRASATRPARARSCRVSASPPGSRSPASGADSRHPRFGDAALTLLAAARVLGRHQAEPRRQMTSRPKTVASPTVAASAVAATGPIPGMSSGSASTAVSCETL